jgi:hypothetical protein
VRVPARTALLADITGPGTYGRAYWSERMMDNLGAVGGVVAKTPVEIQGFGVRVLAAIQSFGNLAASGIVGLLWTLISPLAAFLFAAMGMTVALLADVSLRSRWGRRAGNPDMNG